MKPKSHSFCQILWDENYFCFCLCMFVFNVHFCEIPLCRYIWKAYRKLGFCTIQSWKHNLWKVHLGADFGRKVKCNLHVEAKNDPGAPKTMNGLVGLLWNWFGDGTCRASSLCIQAVALAVRHHVHPVGFLQHPCWSLPYLAPSLPYLVSPPSFLPVLPAC